MWKELPLLPLKSLCKTNPTLLEDKWFLTQVSAQLYNWASGLKDITGDRSDQLRFSKRHEPTKKVVPVVNFIHWSLDWKESCYSKATIKIAKDKATHHNSKTKVDPQWVSTTPLKLSSEETSSQLTRQISEHNLKKRNSLSKIQWNLKRLKRGVFFCSASMNPSVWSLPQFLRAESNWPLQASVFIRHETVTFLYLNNTFMKSESCWWWRTGGRLLHSLTHHSHQRWSWKEDLLSLPHLRWTLIEFPLVYVSRSSLPRRQGT